MFRKNNLNDQSNTRNKVLFLANSCETDDGFWIQIQHAHITNNKKLFKDMKKTKSEIGTKESQILKRVGVIETEKCILNKDFYVADLNKKPIIS